MSNDPYEAFEIWMRQNGFTDVANCEPGETNLTRLHEAVHLYGLDDTLRPFMSEVYSAGGRITC